MNINEFDAQAFIFDCDGTLAITAEAHFAATEQAFAAQGLTFPKGWYFERTGMSLKALTADYHAVFGQVVDIDALLRVEEPAFLQLAHLIKPHQEILDVARALKGKHPMSVGSNATKIPVHFVLETIGATDLFDHVVTLSDPVANGKPAPDIFLYAAQLMGHNPSDCHVFEDSDEGIKAAQAAGMSVTDVRSI